MTASTILEQVLGHWDEGDQTEVLCEYIDLLIAAQENPFRDHDPAPPEFPTFLASKVEAKPDWDEIEFDDSTTSKSHKRLRETIFDTLKNLGVEEVELEYSGSGDDGSYDDPAVTVGGPVDLNKVDVPILEKDKGILSYYTVTERGLEHRKPTDTVTLNDAIKALCEAWGDEFVMGWYDGNGASGTFTFDVPKRYVKWSHGAYTEDQEWTEYKV